MKYINANIYRFKRYYIIHYFFIELNFELLQLDL